MLDSKVVDSIKALSTEEAMEFGMFLKSPYFQKGFTADELQQFYAMIQAAIADPQSAALEKFEAHQLLFPDKAFSDGRMDRIMFELNRLVKFFLLTRYYHRQENEAQQLLDWSIIQRKKSTASGFEKQLQKLRKELSSSGKDSGELFLNLYLIAREEYEWQSTYNKVKGNLGIPEAIDHLDTFYFATRMELLNSFLLQQKATSIETPALIRLALNSASIPEHYLDQSPLLLITAKIHELFRNEQPNPDGFQELLHLLKQFETKISPKVLYQFYVYLRNYCTILIDAGNAAFEISLHDIQRDNLTRGYFYYEGKIPPNAVLNITMLAIRVNKVEWARDFIEAHKFLIIGENEAQDFYGMNQALCLFAEKKYSEALDVIPFGTTYSSYHLMARRLELKIYFETNSELLLSKIDAFKMFVSRAGNKSFSASLSELYSNFGNFVQQLSQSIPGDKKRSEQLVSRIQAKKLVAERGWLLEKAKELGESKI